MHAMHRSAVGLSTVWGLVTMLTPFHAVARMNADESAEARADAPASPASPSAEGAEDSEVVSTSVTVYSAASPAAFDPRQFIEQNRQGWSVHNVPGFGVVRETRALDLDKGIIELRYTDVAQHIDPTTVAMVDVSEPGATQALEQSFRFDLVSPTKIFERHIGKQINLRTTVAGETVLKPATLLSINQGRLVLMTEEGISFISPTDSRIHFASLPEGLVVKPTLVWRALSAKQGKRELQTSYMTEGLTWRADYNLVLDERETSADLGAWVTLMNLSGASYRNASLKLVAGDVQRVTPTREMFTALRYSSAQAEAVPASIGFETKPFFAYHLYTLPRKTDILNNATQQIALFPTKSGARVEKTLVYYGNAWARQYYGSASPHTDRELGSRSNTKVDVYLNFRNSEENNLGVPLPAGKVRVYKRDSADGALEFIGEDVIDHTPRNENVRILLGQSFDVVGERVQTDFRKGHRWVEESYRITVRNRSEETVKVLVRESMWRWSEWEMLKTSSHYDKVDSRTLHFPVGVEPDGEAVVEYTVRYTW